MGITWKIIDSEMNYIDFETKKCKYFQITKDENVERGQSVSSGNKSISYQA